MLLPVFILERPITKWFPCWYGMFLGKKFFAEWKDLLFYLTYVVLILLFCVEFHQIFMRDRVRVIIVGFTPCDSAPVGVLFCCNFVVRTFELFCDRSLCVELRWKFSVSVSMFLCATYTLFLTHVPDNTVLTIRR